MTKILKGCPEGTEFYCPIYGSVSFQEINHTSEYPIKTKRGIKPADFTSDGNTGVLIDLLYVVKLYIEEMIKNLKKI